jgi:alcohol dehydrogenase class IV
MPNQHDFTWRDGERTIVFRAGAFVDTPGLLAAGGWKRFELLTTPRALGAASVELAEASSAVHQVPGGPVPDAAAALIRAVGNPDLVALGGGRVIDTAKAIAAVRGGRVCALPTTLSGAEMTIFHRLPAGREREARQLVRPVLVVADPIEMTSLDEHHLRASAINALAHGAEALYGPLANPVATMAALRGAARIAAALDQPAEERDRSALALGSLLSAFAIGSTGFALHHVVCQTLVRVLELPHAETNAAMLPRTMAAMRKRASDQIRELATSLGTDPARIQSRIQALGGGRRRLRDLCPDPDPARLSEALDAILSRPELDNTPMAPGRDELHRLLERAW